MFAQLQDPGFAFMALITFSSEKHAMHIMALITFSFKEQSVHVVTWLFCWRVRRVQRTYISVRYWTYLKRM